MLFGGEGGAGKGIKECEEGHQTHSLRLSHIFVQFSLRDPLSLISIWCIEFEIQQPIVVGNLCSYNTEVQEKMSVNLAKQDPRRIS